MPDKILLIADDESLGRLRQFGDLPLEFLRTQTLQELMEWHLKHRHGVAVVSQKFFAPEAGGKATADSDIKDWLVRGLPDTTVCWLSIPTQSTDASPRKPASKKSSGSAESPFAESLRRFEELTTTITNRRQLRNSKLHAVLIVVFPNSPSAADALLLKSTMATSNHAIRQSCYVMMPELEASSDQGHVFDAVHVWPISVSGLLLSLLLNGPPVDWNQGSAAFYVWRNYFLVPDLNTTTLDRSLARGTEAFQHQLAANIDQDNTAAENVKRGDAISDLPSSPHWPRVSWIDQNILPTVSAMQDRSRWDANLKNAGSVESLEQTRLVLEHQVAESQQAQRHWQQIAGNPVAAGRILNDRRSIVSSPLEQVNYLRRQQWSDLSQTDSKIATDIQTFDECSQHYVLSQHGFVSQFRRVCIAAAVAACVLYFCLAMADGVFGGTGPAWLLAFFGLLGSFTGAFLFLDLETRAGRRAEAELRKELETLDEQVKQRHRDAVESVRTAEALRRIRVLELLDARSRYLMRRVAQAMQRMTPQSGTRECAASDMQISSEESNQTTSALGSIQRRLFRSCLQLQQVFIQNHNEQEQQEELKEFVARLCDQFLNESWRPFAKDADLALRGYYPQDRLLPLVDAFRERLESELTQWFQMQAVTNSRPQEAASGNSWQTSLLSICRQSFPETMSCRMDATLSPDHSDRHTQCLILRESIVPFLQEGIRDLQPLRMESFAADVWTDFPFAGILFHQVPVSIDADETNLLVRPFNVGSTNTAEATEISNGGHNP